MGIENIYILHEVDSDNPTPRLVEMTIAALVEAHNRGEHTYGKQYRACPLCR